MRISKIKIKNFKSIDNIGEVKFLDNSIACIIGKNGSGKSNFLHALHALKKHQNLDDNQRYEKAKKDDPYQTMPEDNWMEHEEFNKKKKKSPFEQ